MQCLACGNNIVLPSAPALPARARLSRQPVRVRATASTETKVQTSKSNDSPVEEIYLGFDKYDTTPRAGRKGRTVKDDPRKYPGKEDYGFFIGAAGGWAGGEAAIQKIKEEAKAKKEAQSKPKVAEPAPKVLEPGKDAIYVGFAKDELELKKSGVKGRFVVDDARKYPAKDDYGFLVGAAGGFAGGEAGLKTFVQTGKVPVAKPGVPVRKQSSAVAFGGLLALIGTGGALLLNELGEVGEDVVKEDIIAAPIDDKTKTLLLAAVAVLTGAGLILGGRALVSNVQESLRENVQKLVIFGAFWIVVFFAARAVLEI